MNCDTCEFPEMGLRSRHMGFTVAGTPMSTLWTDAAPHREARPDRCHRSWGPCAGSRMLCKSSAQGTSRGAQQLWYVWAFQGCGITTVGGAQPVLWESGAEPGQESTGWLQASQHCPPLRRWGKFNEEANPCPYLHSPSQQILQEC